MPRRVSNSRLFSRQDDCRPVDLTRGDAITQGFKKRVLFAVVSLTCLAACQTPSEETARLPAANAIDLPLLGSDRDAHGCIPSAGYVWSAQWQRCVRPWEVGSPAVPK